MPKKKAAKSAAKTEKNEATKRAVRGVFVTWRNVLNCDQSRLQTVTVKDAAAAARAAGYEFFTHNHRLFFSTAEGTLTAIDFPTERLDVGAAVHLYADDTVASVEPKEKKLYVVTRVAFDYNDECYYTVGEGAGHASAVFDDKDEAEKVARTRSIDELVGVDDLFDYIEYQSQYSDIVTMSWPVWQDWLRDRGIDPPAFDIESDDDDVDREVLRAWWTRGMGGRTWNAATARYEAVNAGWTTEQQRAVAEHINLDFYRVDEVPYNAHE